MGALIGEEKEEPGGYRRSKSIAMGTLISEAAQATTIQHWSHCAVTKGTFVHSQTGGGGGKPAVTRKAYARQRRRALGIGGAHELAE